MRLFFNISNITGILGILLLFLIGLYQILWESNLFPYTSFLIGSLYAFGPFVSVLLSRKSSIYIYGLLSLLNFVNMFFLVYGFFKHDFIEQMWSVQFFLGALIIFLGLLFFLNRFKSIFTRFIQVLIAGNIAIYSYFLFENNYNSFIHKIILIYSSSTFILSITAVSFYIIKTKDINKDKSRNHEDGEANNLIA